MVIMIVIMISNCQNLVGEHECPLTGTDKKHVNRQNNENMYIPVFKKLDASCYIHIINGRNYCMFYNLYNTSLV